jgi:hypothetical protein
MFAAVGNIDHKSALTIRASGRRTWARRRNAVSYIRTETKMKLVAVFQLVAAVLASIAGAAGGVDLSLPFMVVATSHLAGSVYEQTVVVTAPLPQGGHIGFIINRPTNVKLETLFPDQAACRQVVDPVYLGGPGLRNAVFALTRSAPDEGGSAIQFMPGLFAVLDGTAVDRAIETTPKNALLHWCNHLGTGTA